jgi:tRNA A-37 threonylcarbamoyl transferase component Bud32
MKRHFGIEDVFPAKRAAAQESVPETISEDDAENMLQQLLALPEHAFLTEVRQNRDTIENANSFAEALAFAQRRIRERLEATLSAHRATYGHIESVQVHAGAIIEVFTEMMRHTTTIGEGADGRVVIDSREEYLLNPEVCYKLALTETVKRGRNSMIEELEMQCAFYEAAEAYADKRIGVPEPYYEVDMGNAHMIVMEKLHARSIDDLLRGFGGLPDGFDVDQFCDALRAFLTEMHKQHLYHRDLHYGNIMITQKVATLEDAEQPMGYVIDFGLSSRGFEGMDPYKRDLAGVVFTYDDDYGRIEGVRMTLKNLQNRQLLRK